MRARLKRGDYLTFINNGQIAHTIVAQDGSWTTGVLKPGESTSLEFDKAGTFRYACKEHPWAIAELAVTP